MASTELKITNKRWKKKRICFFSPAIIYKLIDHILSHPNTICVVSYGYIRQIFQFRSFCNNKTAIRQLKMKYYVRNIMSKSVN